MPRNTGSRTWVYVTGFVDLPLNYGFKSGLDQGLRGQFGQSPITSGTPVQNLIIAPNNCYPAREIRTRVTGSEGSYCDHTRIASLRQANFKIVPGKAPKGRRSTGRSSAVMVTLNGVKYAWSSPGGTTGMPTGVGFRTAIGENDAIYGASFPKPPRMKMITESGSDSFSTFVDPGRMDTLETQGWQVVHEGCYTLQHLARFIG